MRERSRGDRPTVQSPKVLPPLSFVICPLSFFLRTIAKSENPYVVTWGSQPNATFTLDGATGKNFKIEADGTGIKIIPRAGITFFIR